MQKDPKDLSHQELFDSLREVRQDIYLIDQTIRSHIKSVLVPESENIKASLKNGTSKRFIDGLGNIRRSLQASRHSLRETLEIADTSACYPDPIADLPDQPHPLSFGLEGLADKIEELEDLLKDLITATAEYYMEGWAVKYHEEAVMCLTQAKHELRVCSKLQDEESTIREKERVQGSTDSLRSTNRGFQVSGRAGQH